MKFSIVTPSFKQHDWLRLCAASVADQDQSGVEFEHVVQDAGCPPEPQAALKKWAASLPHLRLVIEKDQGMYDAINRGLKKASGDLCAYLNCDEQYLPGALQKVHDCFARQPEVEVVFADTLVVDGKGHYLCHRQSLLPQLRHTVACHLATFTCATFFRRSLVERGLLFDTSFRGAGDCDWVVRLLQAGVRMAHLPEMVSTFADTGENLGLTELMDREMARIQSRFPSWWTRCALGWATLHRLRRWRAGYYRPKPLSYAIYTLQQPERRTVFPVDKPTFLWKSRFAAATFAK